VRTTATSLALPPTNSIKVEKNLEATQKKDIQVNDHDPSLNRTGFLLQTSGGHFK
jgi:hypothetical protein